MRLVLCIFLLTSACADPVLPVDPKAPQAGEYELSVARSASASRYVLADSAESGSRICVREGDRANLEQLFFPGEGRWCKDTIRRIADGRISIKSRCVADDGDLTNSTTQIEGRYHSEGWETSALTVLLGDPIESRKSYRRVGDC